MIAPAGFKTGQTPIAIVGDTFVSLDKNRRRRQQLMAKSGDGFGGHRQRKGQRLFQLGDQAAVIAEGADEFGGKGFARGSGNDNRFQTGGNSERQARRDEHLIFTIANGDGIDFRGTTLFIIIHISLLGRLGLGAA